MKKLILSTCLLGLPLLHAEEAMTPSELDRKIYATMLQPPPHKADASWLTGELRTRVITKMLEKLAGSTSMTETHQAKIVLVQLNHTDTIRAIITANAAGKDDDTFLLGAHAPLAAFPIMVEALDDASAEDPVSLPGNDVIHSSPREILGEVLLKMIYKNEQIPQKTRDWATEFSSAFSMRPELQTGVIKEFWQMNRKAIVSGHPADITRTPEYTVVRSKAYERMREIQAAQEKLLQENNLPAPRQAE